MIVVILSRHQASVYKQRVRFFFHFDYSQSPSTCFRTFLILFIQQIIKSQFINNLYIITFEF